MSHVRSIKKVENLRLAAANYKMRMRAGSLIDENGGTSCSEILIKRIQGELVHRSEPIGHGEPRCGAKFKKAVTKR